MEFSYKFRLYPNETQRLFMQKMFGCKRFVYNHFLAERIDLYNKTGKAPTCYDQIRELPQLKREYPWLTECDSTALQAAVRDLDRAYQNFFRGSKKRKKVGYPKFKSKRNSRQSYRSMCVGPNIKVLDKYVQLPKIGLVKCKVSKVVQGRILSATVSCNATGKYFVSINCTDVSIDKLPATGETVGIDLGLADLVIERNGTKYPNQRYLNKSLKKLARLQRRLSRKPRGSRNRNKARLRVARLHEHIANQRKDMLHKLTTDLIRKYDVICIEDLAVSNMMHNHKIARSISDAAWGEIERQLTYKAVWYGRSIGQVDRFFASSQICHCCGFKNPAVKDVKVRTWTCPACGAVHDRDVNASINIHDEGMRRIASNT